MIYDDYGLLYRKEWISAIEIGYRGFVLSVMVEVPLFLKDLKQHKIIPKEELGLVESQFLKGRYMSAVDSVYSDFTAYAWLNNLTEMLFKTYPKLNRELFSHMTKEKPVCPRGKEVVCSTVEEVLQELERKVRKVDSNIQKIAERTPEFNIHCRTKEEWNKLPKEIRSKYEPLRFSIGIAGRLEPLNGDYVQWS